MSSLASAPADSIETPYGWTVASVSVAIMSIGFGAPYVITVGLKGIAAEYDWPRWIPSLAVSASYIGAGLGGILMGYSVFRGIVDKTPRDTFDTKVLMTATRDGFWSLLFPFFIFFGTNFGWLVDRIGSLSAFLALGVALPLLLVLVTIVLTHRVARSS